MGNTLSGFFLWAVQDIAGSLVFFPGRFLDCFLELGCGDVAFAGKEYGDCGLGIGGLCVGVFF